MKETSRGPLSVMLWFISGIVLAALFIGSGMSGELTTAHMIFAGIILTLDVIGTAAIWMMPSLAVQVEKSKRQRIDDMVRDMSDDELVQLKQRLSDGDYSEESLLEYVSEDGELVFRS